MVYESVARDSLELASLASSQESSPSATPRRQSSSSPKGSLENLVRDEDPLADNHLHAPSSRRRERSHSVSSVFDFNSSLFPLSMTAEGGYAPLGVSSTLPLDREGVPLDGTLERRKTLTYLNGMSLVISCIIGSGIFSSPGRVTAGVGSSGAAIIVWVSAGILAWTGAASYAELGGTIPLNGGAQVYLAKIFGEWVGFSYTWCAVLVLKPGSQGIISIILGEYVVSALHGGDVVDINTTSPWVSKGVAISFMMIIILLNSMSTRLGTRITDGFMFFKFIALIGVMVIGIIVATTGLSYDGKPNTEWKTENWFANTSHNPSNWAVALYAGLWAFEGWDNMSYVIGEFKNPSRDLPRVIHTAMPIVVLLFVVANVSYFLVLPASTIVATNTIGVHFGKKVLGPVGAIVLAFVVSGSCFGSLNASMFTYGRLVYVAGREGYLPSMFGRLGFRETIPEDAPSRRARSKSHKIFLKIFGDDIGLGYTPIYAMLLNGVITTIYIIVGDFSQLVTFYGVAGYLYYFLTVLGLIVLRIREPNLERPYKTWITTPITFCCVSLFLLSRAVIAEPIQTLIVLAFIILGVPVYFWRMNVRDGQSLLEKWRDGRFRCFPFRRSGR
ncbi:hypothetical protein KEM56_005115 [Ascosphaera pollenicola]|nr:hypothetical protein KEM56_005115 [Ascosphaera pollenicola]